MNWRVPAVDYLAIEMIPPDATVCPHCDGPVKRSVPEFRPEPAYVRRQRDTLAASAQPKVGDKSKITKDDKDTEKEDDALYGS